MRSVIGTASLRGRSETMVRFSGGPDAQPLMIAAAVLPIVQRNARRAGSEGSACLSSSMQIPFRLKSYPNNKQSNYLRTVAPLKWNAIEQRHGTYQRAPKSYDDVWHSPSKSSRTGPRS